MEQLKEDFTIAGLRWPIYAIVLIVTLVAMYYNALPKGMVGGFLVLIVFGELLNLIGNKAPIISTYFGGGAIVCIFGGAALVYFGLVPKQTLKISVDFMKSGGFLNFYIAALITGSILGMNRKLLIKACVRYLPCILASVAVALIFVSIGGLLFSMPVGKAMAYIGIPIMGGGMGAGAIPISKIFAGALHLKFDDILAQLVPAVALGNAMAIVAAGLLDRLGKSKPSLTGNGALVCSKDVEFQVEKEADKAPATLPDYCAGIVASTAFFALGTIIAKFTNVFLHPYSIHPYAWMIISVAVVKALDLLPERTNRACEVWYNFVAKNFTGALMLGIGIAYTSMATIIEAITIQYVVLCFLVIVGAIIGAGLVGRLVGFYFVESAITAGLCMANMGGTGDVAVLTAAKRMELMPFAQISSRLGGAFIMLLASFLVPFFFG